MLWQDKSRNESNRKPIAIVLLVGMHMERSLEESGPRYSCHVARVCNQQTKRFFLPSVLLIGVDICCGMKCHETVLCAGKLSVSFDWIDKDAELVSLFFL